jgi:hypothetical protein
MYRPYHAFGLRTIQEREGMTYKDHGELALILREHLDKHMRTEGHWSAYDALTALVDDIADYCERDNPRFDRDRFMIGTGIGIV